jgi:MFS family permease
MIAVPLLALAGNWQIAALLIIAERTGKGVRTPVRDVMLSHAASEMGRGWGFALHEAMDQIGAMLGPLIVAAVLYFRNTYQTGFAVLLVPAILAICVLITAALLYPHPRSLELSVPPMRTEGLSKRYWVYLTAMALIAAGYADFPLIAFHFQKAATVPGDWIPVFYAVAMGVDAIAALIFGRLFDRKGIISLIISVFVSAFFAPLVLFGGIFVSLAGMVVWGVGMGAQESVMRAAVAEMVPADKRGTAYGIFNTGYGIFWFLGSALMGYLYDLSRSSDFPATCMVGLRFVAFPTRPEAFSSLGVAGISRFPRKECPCMLRVFDCVGLVYALPLSSHTILPSAALNSVSVRDA